MKWSTRPCERNLSLEKGSRRLWIGERRRGHRLLRQANSSKDVSESGLGSKYFYCRTKLQI